jgi:hypothetical protein
MQDYAKKQGAKMLKILFGRLAVLSISPKYPKNEISVNIILHFCIQCHIISP